jgi:hypothetical protein
MRDGSHSAGRVQSPVVERKYAVLRFSVVDARNVSLSGVGLDIDEWASTSRPGTVKS